MILRVFQFLCVKNIRMFLTTCKRQFNMKTADLFENYDLFDVRDFGKVSAVLHVFILF